MSDFYCSYALTSYRIFRAHLHSQINIIRKRRICKNHWQEGQSTLVCLRDRSRKRVQSGRQRCYWPFEERLSESTFLPERREVWQFPWANLLVGHHWDAAGLLSRENWLRGKEKKKDVAASSGLIHRPRTPGGPMNYTSDSLSLFHLVSLSPRYPPLLFSARPAKANERFNERTRKRQG